MSEMKKILNKLSHMSLRVPTKSERSNLYLVVFLIFIFSFLFLNIYFSQKISPIFFGLTNNNKKSIVEFLQKIRKSSDFNQQLKYFEGVYGPSIKTQVFAEEKERERMINQFEQILEKNHQSRDVLYRLYKLYLEKGDKLIAEKYFRLAKAIDPTIK